MPRKRLDLEWLKQHYPRMTTIDTLLDEYEQEFGWRPNRQGVYVKANRLGLHKDPVEGRGDRAERTVCWAKEPEMEVWMMGHDRGQRMDELQREWRERWGFGISRGQINLFRASHGKTVRKGHGGRHRVPVGTERPSKDGYLVIKVAEEATVPMSKDNWKLKHVWVWEQENGPLPDGHSVYFADGDRRNFTKDNLVAVPNRLVGQMNTLKSEGVTWHDAESLKAVMAMAEIRIARNEAMARQERVCKCCGKHYTNWQRYKAGGCVKTTICPECGRKGRKPPTGDKRKPRFDRDRMRELSARGWTNKAIADELGCSPNLVSQVLTGELDRRKQQRRERWK